MTEAPAVIRGEGRPTKGGYKLADGKTRVPSATTITGYIKGEGLMRWAYQQGADGLELYERRDQAAQAGGIVHQWIEDHFHGAPQTTFPNVPNEAYQGFDAFLEWVRGINPQIVETETPLVSEEHLYGGTFDAIGILGKDHVLFDWKTSNSTYPSYIAQVAAYRQLLRERDGDKAPNRAYLIRVGKEFGDFHFHSWTELILDEGWKWFQAAFTLYRLDKSLAKVAR